MTKQEFYKVISNLELPKYTVIKKQFFELHVNHSDILQCVKLLKNNRDTQFTILTDLG